MLKYDLEHFNTAVVLEDKWILAYDKRNKAVIIDESKFREILESMFRYGDFCARTGCTPNEFIFD